jgi:CPA1 family monovalent cation:H+ antiporter
MVLTLLPMAPKISFTKEIIFDLLLPPLIFEAAFYLRWNQLRRELPVIFTLASAGVVLSGATVAVGMHSLAGWEWSSALVFGCLIAATDPVAVIATFSEAKVHGRLRLLIESESLFNDGTAAVAFGFALLFATRASPDCCRPDQEPHHNRWRSPSVWSTGERSCPVSDRTHRRPFGRAYLHDGCRVWVLPSG